MKYYLDEMFAPVLAAMLRARGIDAVSAIERGWISTADRVHLSAAAGERRCVVTMNVRDFIDLTVEFARQGAMHAGVVLVSSTIGNEDFGAIAAALAGLRDAYPDRLKPYAVLWLPPAPSS